MAVMDKEVDKVPVMPTAKHLPPAVTASASTPGVITPASSATNPLPSTKKEGLPENARKQRVSGRQALPGWKSGLPAHEGAGT